MKFGHGLGTLLTAGVGLVCAAAMKSCGWAWWPAAGPGGRAACGEGHAISVFVATTRLRQEEGGGG